jgi:GR25 family glycosyltransferase involved in LPS biosynthesis
MLRKPLPTLVISLDRDADRYARLAAAFAPTPAFALQRVPGVLGSTLPAAAVAALTGGRADHPRGALGCTLSHVMAWEMALRSRAPWTLILEDDAVPAGIGRLFRVELPDDADLVMVTRRADMLGAPPKSEPRAVPLATHAAARASLRPDARRAPGAEGYLLSRRGAGALLGAVARDGFHSFVDWRLWRYGLDAEDLSRLADSGFADILGKQPNGAGDAVYRGYALSPGLLKHPRGDSRRKVVDDEGAVPGG